MKSIILISLTFFVSTTCQSAFINVYDTPTRDDGAWYLLTQHNLPPTPHHLQHAEIFGRDITGYNYLILKAIDLVQSTAMDGGRYFIGKDANPPESPVGHILNLFDKPLLSPPRQSSYCTGATYAAFIEALNSIITSEERLMLSQNRFEAFRMQELDGGRREDHMKFWGRWNADLAGHSYALIQYTGMGKVIAPNSARPGDFVNIVWKNNRGHAVIFLGWEVDEKGEKNLIYWSSQPSTNGFGDSQTHLSNTKKVTFVRLINPRRMFSFDVDTPVNL